MLRFSANLQFAAAALERAGIQLLVEPLNSRDVPGFVLTSTRDALALIDAPSSGKSGRLIVTIY